MTGVLLLTPCAFATWRIEATGLLWAAGSACAELAYGLVLVAFTVARPEQVPVVAALRETSVPMVPS
jgi:hypothetical protein